MRTDARSEVAGVWPVAVPTNPCRPFHCIMTVPRESAWSVGTGASAGLPMVGTDGGAWALKEEENGKVYLAATLTAKKGNPAWKTWHGKLKFPVVRIDWRTAVASDE